MTYQFNYPNHKIFQNKFHLHPTFKINWCILALLARIHKLYSLKAEFLIPSKRGVGLGIMLNCIKWWYSKSKALASACVWGGYPFIAITLPDSFWFVMGILVRVPSISQRSVWKLFDTYTWNHITLKHLYQISVLNNPLGVDMPLNKLTKPVVLGF